MTENNQQAQVRKLHRAQSEWTQPWDPVVNVGKRRLCPGSEVDREKLALFSVAFSTESNWSLIALALRSVGRPTYAVESNKSEALADYSSYITAYLQQDNQCFFMDLENAKMSLPLQTHPPPGRALVTPEDIWRASGVWESMPSHTLKRYIWPTQAIWLTKKCRKLWWPSGFCLV